MEKERRSVKRINISYYVPIINAESYEKLGILSDISIKGLLIDSQKILPINQVFKLRLDLSDEGFDRPFLNFSAQVKSVRQDRFDPGFYNIGFEVQNLKESDERIFQRIMELYVT